MGMAHRNNASGYTRRYVITQHVIDRCREYVHDERLGRLADHDVGHLVDEYVHDALKRKDFETWYERDEKRGGEIARNIVVPIGDRFDRVVDGALYALMRTIDSGRDRGSMISLTLLTADAVKRSKNTRWKAKPEQIVGAAVTQSPFADIVARITATPPEPAPEPMTPAKPLRKVAPVAQVTPIPTSAQPRKREVITGACVVLMWHDGTSDRFAKVLANEADRFVAKLVLVDGVDAERIEVFEASTRKVKIEVGIS